MDFWIRLLDQYGIVVVFFNVLLVQLGAPLPAYPVLMLTGALAARGRFSLPELLAVAVVACLLADSIWYAAGLRFGRGVLRLLCRVSLSPDSCVRQTESIFTRWGAPSLLVAKFVPGFSSVATALAGAMHIGRGAFVLFDALGAALWAGVGLVLGSLFSDAIDEVLLELARFGRWGLVLLATAVVAFVAVRWWQRRSFNSKLRMDRISVAELTGLIDAGKKPLIVDVRSLAGQAEGRIPGAVALTGDELPALLSKHSRDALVVVYCACPNDASAVLAARKLLERGFTLVMPLAGGADAWRAAGGGLEGANPEPATTSFVAAQPRKSS